jgi:serine/threonine protein kinase
MYTQIFKLYSFVLQFYGYAFVANIPTLVMELADEGSLDRRIRRADTPGLQLTSTQKYGIALGFIEGLQYLHSNHIVHRDLKPGNILLFGSQLIPKIADFGMSKIIEKTMATMKTVAGTPVYQAPETFETENEGYTSKSDIYSASLILYELLSGQNPLACDGYNVARIMQLKMKEHSPVPSPNIPEDVFVAVSNGYRLDPRKRPVLSKLLSVIYDASKPVFTYDVLNGDCLKKLGILFTEGM